MAQYSREQLIRLASLSTDVLMATLLIDQTDRVGLLREFRNGTKFIEEIKNRYPQNSLIQNMRSGVEESMQDIQNYTLAQRRRVGNSYRTRINEALQFLDSDTETQEFKVGLFNLAKRVAEAAGHGIFGSGQKVSQDENDFLYALQQALEIA